MSVYRTIGPLVYTLWRFVAEIFVILLVYPHHFSVIFLFKVFVNIRTLGKESPIA